MAPCRMGRPPMKSRFLQTTRSVGSFWSCANRRRRATRRLPGTRRLSGSQARFDTRKPAKRSRSEGLGVCGGLLGRRQSCPDHQAGEASRAQGVCDVCDGLWGGYDLHQAAIWSARCDRSKFPRKRTRGEGMEMTETNIYDGGFEECPSCGGTTMRRITAPVAFTYGTDERAVELTADVPAWECGDCDELITAEGAEVLQHEAVCHFLGRLTPSEIVALRKRLELTQSEFAARLGVSRPSIARWETGL